MNFEIKKLQDAWYENSDSQRDKLELLKNEFLMDKAAHQQKTENIISSLNFQIKQTVKEFEDLKKAMLPDFTSDMVDDSKIQLIKEQIIQEHREKQES